MRTESLHRKRLGASPSRASAAVPSQLDVPWTMKLPDGRTLVVEIPAKWTTRDRDGTLALLPEAVRFIDRVQVLLVEQDRAPSPGYVRTLREALGLTQADLAKQLGVNKLTIARWEWGTEKPRRSSVDALRQLRRQAIKRGVALGPSKAA